MTQTNNIQTNPAKPSYGQCQPQPLRQQITEPRIKELILETLIELNLVPKPQKKQVMTIE
jgi:hypothetical protein